MFHRITVGLKGEFLRVASVAEVAARLLLLVGGAPQWLSGDGLVLPFKVGGLLAVVGSCRRDCPAVRLPAVALGAGVPVGHRFRRGWALSGIPSRSISPSRGWPSSSSVCLHWVLCTCLCQCTGGGGGGGPQHSLEDPRIIAFGGGGGGGIGADYF